MILQALACYHDRLVGEAESTIAPKGFEKKEIPFVIVLDRQGSFVGLQDTRQGEGKRKPGRVSMVPKAVKRSSGIAANLLWDTPAYVLKCPKPDTKKDYETLLERAAKQHAAFVARIREAFPADEAVWKDEGLLAVKRFLERGDFSCIFSHDLWPEIEDSGANLSFQLEGDTQLICQRPAVVRALNRANASATANSETCLVTGEQDEPARLHTAIKGVWGAQSSGANIVSFNLDAFTSHHRTQGYNAPVGRKAEFAYTTALNTLLAKGSRQRIQVGDATTVFWAARPTPMEGWFLDFFGQPATGGSTQDNEAIRALYAAPKTGAPPLDEDLTPFYVLGLAPNASRIAVRFWYSGTVGEVARHIRQHFEDIAIVHGPMHRDHLTLFQLLVSTAVRDKSENVHPKLAGDVMRSVLAGAPYPRTLLASAIIRARAKQEVTYPRAAAIKAVISRDARCHQQQNEEVGMALSTTNTSPGYLLGRLFAVLEWTQERAIPNANATIRDRFYGAASSTPVAVFPHLLKLKNHHVAKLENKGLAVNLEKQIGGIMSGIDDFPAHLSLADQGRFAVGYYHQRQALFTKKGDKTHDIALGNNSTEKEDDR